MLLLFLVVLITVFSVPDAIKIFGETYVLSLFSFRLFFLLVDCSYRVYFMPADTMKWLLYRFLPQINHFTLFLSPSLP